MDVEEATQAPVIIFMKTILTSEKKKKTKKN